MAGRIRAGIRTARNRAAAAIRLYGKKRAGRLRQFAADESTSAQGHFYAARAWETVPHERGALAMADFNRTQNRVALRRTSSARRSAERTRKWSRTIANKVRGKKRK